MALIQCVECARQISDQAEVCPGCGIRVRVETPSELPNFRLKFPHPGTMPTISAMTLQNKFVQMGTLAGRTQQEIINVVGPPNTTSSPGPGLILLQWIRVGSFVGGFHIALIFDENGVCGGVTHQSQT
jgi:hypothetical protein